MTSTRPGCMTGIAARRARVAASRSAVTARTSSTGIREPWMASGRRRAAPARARRPSSPSRPAPTSVAASPPAPRRALGQRRADVVLGPPRSRSAVGGSPCRCRSVSRTQPMSTERAARTPSPSPSTNSVEPPPMSTTRNGGRAAARRAPRGASSEAVAPRKDSSASSRPVTTSGACPRVPRTMSSKSPRLAASRVALVADHAHRRRAELARRRRRTRRARAGCARSPPGPAGRWRRRPGRAGRPPSAAAGRCARRRPATSATSSRMELVPQSMAATRVTRRPRSGWAHGPGRPPLPHLGDARSPIGLTPGPGRQRVPGQRVQALDPVGHAAGASCRVGSTSRASRVAR